jgi:hypothetical protein
MSEVNRVWLYVATLVLFVALAAFAGIHYGDTSGYERGYHDGGAAILTAHLGSPSWHKGDESLATDHTCTVRDHTTNLVDARSRCYSGNWTLLKTVRDWNGNGDGGNTGHTGKRIRYHIACHRENWCTDHASDHGPQ